MYQGNACSSRGSFSCGKRCRTGRAALIDTDFNEGDQVIVQIGERFCEYLPQRVETVLYGFSPVHQVEFLNDHGTVLVQYASERVSPAQLVASVEGAVSSGIGCRAWVD